MIYSLSKQVIQGGNYEYTNMLNKLDVYLLGNRISPAQYTELKGLMDNQRVA